MEQYGQAAFEAYRAKMGGKTYDGKAIPEWHELGKQVQDGWMVAAHASIELWIRNSVKQEKHEE